MRTRIVIAASRRLGEDLSKKTPEELEEIISDEMRTRIVIAASRRLGVKASDMTPQEIQVMVTTEMQRRAGGRSGTFMTMSQIVDGLTDGSLSRMAPKDKRKVSQDPAGAEAAAANFRAAWTAAHSSSGDKQAVVGAAKSKTRLPGRRKSFSELKQEMVDFETALGFSGNVKTTARHQWDKYEKQLKARMLGQQDGTPRPTYNGVRADYDPTVMALPHTLITKVAFLNAQRPKDRVLFIQALSVDDARTWSYYAEAVVRQHQMVVARNIEKKGK